MKMSTRECPMRHENGNCLTFGWACTSMGISMCAALRAAYTQGESDGRDNAVLSMVETNRQYQEQSLDILRGIQEKVSGDVVAVVRCRDCRCYEPGVEYYPDGTKDICRLFKRQVQDDCYCSWGERRDENAQM